MTSKAKAQAVRSVAQRIDHIATQIRETRDSSRVLALSREMRRSTEELKQVATAKSKD